LCFSLELLDAQDSKNNLKNLDIIKNTDYIKMGEHLDFGELVKDIIALRELERKIVLTGGCFDTITQGHLYLFRESRKRARELLGVDDGNLVLVVNVVNDERVRGYKGENRPVRDERTRADIVAGQVGVDYSTVYPCVKQGPTIELARHIKPDVIVQNMEKWTPEEKEKVASILGYNVGMIGIEKIGVESTTEIYRRIAARAGIESVARS